MNLTRDVIATFINTNEDIMEQTEPLQLSSQIPLEASFDNIKFIVAPQSVLQELSKPVLPQEFEDGKILNLVKTMTGIMHSLDGVGLSAVQVNVLKRVFILDDAIAGETQGHKVFINPVITNLFGRVEMNEGCLSFPGLMVKVVRAEKLTISALDENANIS